MKTARQITLDLLIRMDTQGAYSNIILDHAFTSSDVDRRFLRRCFMECWNAE